LLFLNFNIYKQLDMGKKQKIRQPQVRKSNPFEDMVKSRTEREEKKMRKVVDWA